MQKVYDKRIAAELQLQKDREKQEEERLRKEKERLLQLEEQQIREKEFYSKQILRRIEDENVKESIRILAKFKEEEEKVRKKESINQYYKNEIESNPVVPISCMDIEIVELKKDEYNDTPIKKKTCCC